MPAPEIVRIVDPPSGGVAEVMVGRGFNCFRWAPALKGGPREALWAPDGFASGRERPTAGGVPLLFPFPGRIGGGRFSWAGETYDLPRSDGRGNAIHGFAHGRPWRLLERHADRVVGEFRLSRDAPEARGLWPGDFRLRAEYRVATGRLELSCQYANVGGVPAPCGFGTHAYFRLPLGGLGGGAGPEQTRIRAPVDAVWPCEGMLPVGAPQPIASDLRLDAGAPLAGKLFDTPYRVAEGHRRLLVAELHDPGTGVMLQQAAEGDFACLVIYTPDHRQAICLEPYTCVPDPFRMSERGRDSGLQVLGVGESRSVRIVLELSAA